MIFMCIIFYDEKNIVIYLIISDYIRNLICIGYLIFFCIYIFLVLVYVFRWMVYNFIIDL